MYVYTNRASLESKESQVSQLESELSSSQDSIPQLQTEVQRLQTVLNSVTSELDETRARLTEYLHTADSLEQSTHTITSLHQVGLVLYIPHYHF